jgi:hypothetical protein
MRPVPLLVDVAARHALARAYTNALATARARGAMCASRLRSPCAGSSCRA